jgi:hypothetical protein
VIMLLAGTIPVMTFIVERWITHRFIDPALAAQPQSAQPVRPLASTTSRRGRAPRTGPAWSGSSCPTCTCS